MDCGYGYTIVAFYMGKLVYSLSVPFAPHASNFDTKMYALAHTSTFVRQKLYHCSSITEVQFYCDASSTLEMIFDPLPHPSQDA